MAYDFDELTNRRGTGSYKWDSCNDASVLPMWVADMDFRTAPVVQEALLHRVEQGIFGYTKVPNAYFKAVTRWFSQRHGWTFPTEWIQYTSGVVPALSVVIKALTRPGQGVLAFTPVYNCFFSSIRNNGCRLVSVPLLRETDGKYHINFDELEQKASLPDVTMLLFCNPHNPGGRVWTTEEMKRVGDICMQNGVRIVSDEIHGEFVFSGHRYVPFASVSPRLQQEVITCTSPSKAFNTAGLQIANIVCADADVRKQIDRAINDNEVCDVNPFGVEGLMAAYTEQGAAWLDDLLLYLQHNFQMLYEVFAREMPCCTVMPLEGTYLAWVDCSALPFTTEEIAQSLLEQEKVWINAGTLYGKDGEHFLRINMACPRSRLQEGLKRIVRGLKRLQQKP